MKTDSKNTWTVIINVAITILNAIAAALANM